MPSDYTGFTVYVEDNTGWDGLFLYGWGDAEFAGAWPGLAVTGTKIINGIHYKYFDLGYDAEKLNLNFTFNNNAGKQLPDISAKVDRDFYFCITDTDSEDVTPQ